MRGIFVQNSIKKKNFQLDAFRIKKKFFLSKFHRVTHLSSSIDVCYGPISFWKIKYFIPYGRKKKYFSKNDDGERERERWIWMAGSKLCKNLCIGVLNTWRHHCRGKHWKPFFLLLIVMNHCRNNEENECCVCIGDVSLTDFTKKTKKKLFLLPSMPVASIAIERWWRTYTCLMREKIYIFCVPFVNILVVWLRLDCIIETRFLYFPPKALSNISLARTLSLCVRVYLCGQKQRS